MCSLLGGKNGKKVLPTRALNARPLDPVIGAFSQKKVQFRFTPCKPQKNTKKHKKMEIKTIEIKKDEVAVCTAEYLAEKLGVSKRHVYTLGEKGVFRTTSTKNGKRYDIIDSLKGLAEYNEAKKAEKAIGGISDGHILSFDEVRSRLAEWGIVGVDEDLLRFIVCISALLSADPAQALATFADDDS